MGDMTEAVPTVGAAAPEPEATAPTASGGSEVEVQATLREWAIDLSMQEVAAGKITFVVINQGQMAHNLTILSDSATVGKTSNFRAADGAQTLEVELQPGTYTIICDLPGHAARGQQTQIVVR
jgi:plastocyanin